MKIVMVLTSHDQLGNTGRKTGFWLEEFAAPYFVFRDAGVDLTLASPNGGQPPVDPRSYLAMARFKKDKDAQADGEEAEVQLTHVVPFLVEDELLQLGAIFEKEANWQPFSLVDGRLIKGQNPASSTFAAQNLLGLLARKAA